MESIHAAPESFSAKRFEITADVFYYRWAADPQQLGYFPIA
jgi:hypothetical protein